jgi:predicted SnoaL-like aldol condensation-catalyzing enzyme
MKKILFMGCAGLVCIFTSCNSSTPATTDAPGTTDSSKAGLQKNLASSDVVMKAFQTGDVSGLDSVISDDFIDHGDMGDKKGKDSLKAMVKFVHASFKDMKFDKVRDDVADGDYVYSWVTYSGTSDGTMGMAKGPYKFNSVEISKFKDGKAVEHWGFIDGQDIAKMMPPPPAKDKLDTGKMKKK